MIQTGHGWWWKPIGQRDKAMQCWWVGWCESNYQSKEGSVKDLWQWGLSWFDTAESAANCPGEPRCSNNMGSYPFLYIVYFLLLSICITWLPSILVSSSHIWQFIFFYLSNHHYIYSASEIVSRHIPSGSIVSDLSLAWSLNTLIEVFSYRTLYFPQYHFLKDFLRRSRDCAMDCLSINNLH